MVGPRGCGSCLSRYWANARQAFSQLVVCLDDPIKRVRKETKTALKAIDPEKAREVGLP
jgi:hypothetical protein